MNDTQLILGGSSSSSASTTTTTTTYYVVQHCWFEGPQHASGAPVDYLRLFSNLEQAERVAFLSTHAHARAYAVHHQRPYNSALVRTLPGGKPGGGVGFCFCTSNSGRLFWTRPVQVTVLRTSSHQNNNARTAHAVVLDGMVGGNGRFATSNVHSRYYSANQPGRIFMSDCATSWTQQAATAVLSQLQRQQQQQHQFAETLARMQVLTMPVSSDSLPTLAEMAREEWPSSEQGWTWALLGDPMTTPAGVRHCRDEAAFSSWSQQQQMVESSMMDDDSEHEHRLAKRQCCRRDVDMEQQPPAATASSKAMVL